MSEQLLYFHTGNSGLSFVVKDVGDGPQVGIRASAFGHPFAESGVFIRPEYLQDIADFFAAQAKRSFSDPYCNVAERPTVYIDGERQP